MNPKTTLIWCVFLLGICALDVGAPQDTLQPPQFVKGDISEIKEKRRVYVAADSPRRSENIVKELKKHNSIEVVGDLASADYVVAYKVEREKVGISIGGGGIPTMNEWVFFGRMVVYIPQKDAPGRLVWETRLRYQVPPPSDPPPTPDWPRHWEQPLEKSAVGRFVRALKKAGGGK